ERFIYLGDTARLPYGTKSPETIIRYSVQSAGALVKRRIKLLVIACNTASSVAIPYLQEAFAPLPVIDVITPGAEAAFAASPKGPIAVIATEATVNGRAYVRAINAHAPNVDVIQQACPLFVPLAEEGLIEGPIPELVAQRYLDPLIAQKPRALVLGCTHYPALKNTIAKVTGPEIVLVDSAATTASLVEKVLRKAGMMHEGESSCSFLVTDLAERFSRVGQIFLGRPIAMNLVEPIDL
ncbi:MAG TPA: glutamate racemase, partial [Rhizomicrobium sp.]|nr:glutamate racemase [Rhizomicrobium sp.]